MIKKLTTKKTTTLLDPKTYPTHRDIQNMGNVTQSSLGAPPWNSLQQGTGDGVKLV